VRGFLIPKKMTLERQSTQEYIDISQDRQAYEASLRALVSRPQKQTNTDQMGFDKDLLITYSGVPRQAEVVTAGQRTYRHYTYTPEQLNSIIESGSLLSGRVPYAVVIPGGRYYWSDLKGAFVTTPEHRADKVGVGNSPYSVDFRLPEDLPLIQLEPGILLVPNINGSPIRVGIHIQ
jgi:hypothetical protein